MGTSAAVDLPWLALVLLDLPARSQVGSDLLDAQIVIRVETVCLGVRGVELRMVYDEQGAAGRNRLEQGRDRLLTTKSQLAIGHLAPLSRADRVAGGR